MKKQYKYPKLMISVSEDDFQRAKILRKKYHINISSFVRDKVRELYESLNSKNKK